MSLFVLDTAGNQELLNNKESKNFKTIFNGKGPVFPKPPSYDDASNESEDEDDGDYGGLPPPNHDISHILGDFITKDKSKTKSEEEMDYAMQLLKAAQESKEKNKEKITKYKNRPNKDLIFPDFNVITGKFNDGLFETDLGKEMKKSNIEGLEQKKGIPMLADKKLRDLRRIEKSKTKGEGWFNMPATEVTEEVENDLKILQMRSVLNPKHFYKKNDLKVLPKYFQIGTVQHSPLDYYKERDTRRNKKKTLVDELLADAEFLKYTKRKYKEVTDRNDRYAHKKAMKKMKKLKKNK